MSNKPTQSTNSCACNNKSGNKAVECKCSKSSSCPCPKKGK